MEIFNRISESSFASSGVSFLDGETSNPMSHPSETFNAIHELAESAGISFDTLKNLLYQNSKDCKLSTAALLAKAIGVTVDELIGLDTISEEDMDCITMFRQMPEIGRAHV